MKSATVASRLSDRSTPKSCLERRPVSARAVSRSVLLGRVPVLMPAPPSSQAFSTSATRLPRKAAPAAALAPAGPPPRTMRLNAHSRIGELDDHLDVVGRALEGVRV